MYLHSITWLIFLTKCSVFFEAGTEQLNTMQTAFMFPAYKSVVHTVKQVSLTILNIEFYEIHWASGQNALRRKCFGLSLVYQHVTQNYCIGPILISHFPLIWLSFWLLWINCIMSWWTLSSQQHTPINQSSQTPQERTSS